jgi:hypothetical protein
MVIDNMVNMPKENKRVIGEATLWCAVGWIPDILAQGDA